MVKTMFKSGSFFEEDIEKAKLLPALWSRLEPLIENKKSLGN